MGAGAFKTLVIYEHSFSVLDGVNADDSGSSYPTGQAVDGAPSRVVRAVVDGQLNGLPRLELLLVGSKFLGGQKLQEILPVSFRDVLGCSSLDIRCLGLGSRVLSVGLVV